MTPPKDPAAGSQPGPDFRALFESAPDLYLVLAPDFTIVAATDAYLRATMTTRDGIVGRNVFDAFPDNPADPAADGVRNLRASLERVLRHRAADAMPVQKYDVRRPAAEGGAFEERYWSAVNSPLPGPGGAVGYVIHHVEDVTEFVRLRARAAGQQRPAGEPSAREGALEGELFLRAQEALEANRKLREANAELTRARAELEARAGDGVERLRQANEALRAEVAGHEQTERLLQRRTEKLRVTLASIGDAVVATDAAGRVTLMNPVAEALTGWPEAEAAGRPLAEVFRIVSARTRRPVGNPVDRVLAEGVVVGLANHTLLVARDGTERPIDDSAAPIRDAAGSVLGVVLIFRDVTERYAAEEALRASEALFRGAFEHTTVATVLLDLGNRFARVNAAFARLFGYSPEEMAGLGLEDITHPEDLAESYALRRRLLAGEQSFVQQKRYRHRGGRTLWGVTNVSLVRDAEGRPLLYVGQVQDVTAQRQAEEALRASEERFRLLVESVRDHAIFMTDAAGFVVTWNLGAERLYGYRAAEAVGLHVAQFHTAEEVAAGAPAERLARAAESGAHQAEGWRLRKDGSRFWAEVITTALPDGTPGESRGFVVVSRDMTERRRLEEQFRQAQKLEAVGRLAGGVAHDFNNLLTVINGYSDVLLAATPPGEPNRDALSAIHEAGNRAAALTSQLLAFSRRAIVEPKVLDLNEVIGQSARLLRRLVGEDVILTTSLASNLHPVKADPTQLEQVVMNLAVNARDAMPRGGRLTIETRNLTLRAGEAGAYPDLPPGRYVQLAVSDTGVGMTDEVKARIFEPFFTTKEPGKGTGLGLAMVYGAVKTHGGHVSVYSEVGVGTTFKILLPATTESLTGSWTGEVRLAPRGTETVLVAEDEESVRKFTRLTLETHGYTVLDGGCGAEALAAAARHPGPVHLLVTDVVMPGMGGRELAESLRARHPGLKVLYVSGYTDDAVVRHGIVEATDAFLQKPFSPLALARKVRAILDGTG
jgi:PAS domain S-box-containing protein